MYQIDPQAVNLPIAELKVGRNIKNIRTQYDDASLKELAESIYEDGLLNPIVVMSATDPEDGADIFEVVCGSRRLRAIQWIQGNLDPDWGEGDVRCTQYGGTLEDAKVLNGVENIEREDVNPVDECEWLFRMVETEGHSQEFLAKKMHRSGQWVSLRLTIHRKGSDDLKQALREGLLSISAAYELAKNLSKEDQDKKIKQARASHEKLIKLEDAKVEGNPDKVSKPSKKRLMNMLAEAEKAGTNPKKRNAHGVAMGLRYVLGLCAEDEAKSAIQYEPEEGEVQSSPGVEQAEEEDSEE
jgi:ParB family transcriptional regulator, chromosome partitioning protein